MERIRDKIKSGEMSTVIKERKEREKRQIAESLERIAEKKRKANG